MPQHPSYASSVIPTLVYSVSWLLIGLAIFGALHWLCRPEQRAFWRSDMKVDLAYWFVGPLIYGYIGFVAYSYAVEYAHLDRIASAFGNFLVSRPVLVQAFIILLLTDALQYWAHRLFHRKPLWRFHCIHHAPSRVDWLTSVRIHPINFILYSTLINLLITLLGFSPRAFIALAPFNTFYGFLVHANLNWTFGPMRYVLASPVFHRWHHTSVDQGGDKNFAPTFPFLDLAFGTFYMPKGQLPSAFGIADRNVPNRLLAQLWYPFRRRAA